MYCNLSSSRALLIYGMKYTNVGICVQVNNAGVMACPQQYTEDGFEYQLGVRLHCHWKSLKISLCSDLARIQAVHAVLVSKVSWLVGSGLGSMCLLASVKM